MLACLQQLDSMMLDSTFGESIFLNAQFAWSLQERTPQGDPDVNDIIPDPESSRWNITTSTSEAVPHCDVVLVTVPTPVTEDLKPDLTYVSHAGRSVFESIQEGREPSSSSNPQFIPV